MSADDALLLRPIGVIRSPFTDRVSAPRQPYVAADAEGTIELYAGHDFEDALADLERWSHVWVLYWFHLNEGWRPKVLPPRSDEKRGVFSTRSPHRPNPIGLSPMKLLRIEGRVLFVRGVDVVDGTPVLDLKPYVPFADIVADASTGWIGTDPDPAYAVRWEPLAQEQAEWLRAAHGVELTASIEKQLALGPRPHAYRRIREVEDGRRVLSVHDWRVRFRIEERAAIVERLSSGYRASQLFGERATDRKLDVHRAFAERFGV
jgi:tRNA-Thr(GGU) m(6)t(6)A37 methyltransferase TsaA